MTNQIGKPTAISRRSFLFQSSGMSLQLLGAAKLIARPALAGLFVAKSGIVACGESKISGPTEKYNNGQNGAQGNLQNKSTESSEYDSSQDEQNKSSESDQSLTTSEDLDHKGSSDPSLESESNSKPKIVSKVQGARPNGGFFSRGAPSLTKAQIESGVAIEATCEGTNHKLVITPEHLAQLAEGKSVRIQSETKTHFGNPTVHNHTITYTPV